MTLTILYRHYDRPYEAGVTILSVQEEVAVRVSQLETRGFVVDE
jgi:hypothetical protein